MLLVTVLLVVGTALLAIGGEMAVASAARLARLVGLPLFALGAVLFGIDLEGVGTREAAKKNSLASSASRPTMSVALSVSRIDWVNLMFFTGCRTSPSSISHRPSRVIPVMIASRGWTTFE